MDINNMKTTKQQFYEFKSWFLHYQKMFNLLDWKVYFQHKDLRDNCFANISVNLVGRVATVRFNLKLEEPDSGVNPKESAKHEALELFICGLCELAESRYVTIDEITAANHAIIRTLEKLIH